MTFRVPVCRPLLPTRNKLATYLDKIDESRTYTNNGPLLRLFEERLSDFCRNRFGFAVVANGTVAIHAALLAVASPVRPERPLCLMPSFTFTGTATAARLAGLEPHFVDVDLDDGMVSLSQLQTHPMIARAGAAIVVGAFGRVPDLAACRAFTERTGVPVVVDAAGCSDAFLSGAVKDLHSVPVALSFHATKAFGIGEGGAVIGGDGLLETVKAVVNFGFGADRTATFEGMNGKISEYAVAVGLAVLDEWPTQREQLMSIVAGYHDAFANARNAAFWMENRWVTTYPHYIAEDAAARIGIEDALHSRGIDSRRWWGIGCHNQPAYRACSRDELPNSIHLIERLVGLPFLVELSREEIRNIAQIVTGAERNGAGARTAAG